MKPAPFKYLRASSLSEALHLLDAHADDIRILAGGQSLVPMLNFRISRFGSLLDINALDDLTHIRIDADALHIGALVRYRSIEQAPEVRRFAPLLQEATHAVAHLPIRTRGTIGGSICHADPAAEYPAVLAVLEAQMLVRSAHGERWIDAANMFLGPYTTALAPNEMLVEVRIPAARDNQLFGFAEYARRPGDLAIVGVAVRLDLDGAIVRKARIAMFGLEDSPLRLPGAEDTLVGRPLTPDSLAAAGAAAAHVPAQTDLHASSALRQHLAGTLTLQVLEGLVRQKNGSDA